ncbi:MAG: hypothetical protein EKK57_11230 [Proteobacteria bacterium]|nr:MAG: hypothetical protein EKK57_11230 [Pseudomonadota bacterium]
MSRTNYIDMIKNTVNLNGRVTQDELAKKVVDLRWYSLRETYKVVKELVDNKELNYIKDESGRYTFYA